MVVSSSGGGRCRRNAADIGQGECRTVLKLKINAGAGDLNRCDNAIDCVVVHINSVDLLAHQARCSADLGLSGQAGECRLQLRCCLKLADLAHLRHELIAGCRIEWILMLELRHHHVDEVIGTELRACIGRG